MTIEKKKRTKSFNLPLSGSPMITKKKEHPHRLNPSPMDPLEYSLKPLDPLEHWHPFSIDPMENSLNPPDTLEQRLNFTPEHPMIKKKRTNTDFEPLLLWIPHDHKEKKHGTQIEPLLPWITVWTPWIQDLNFTPGPPMIIKKKKRTQISNPFPSGSSMITKKKTRNTDWTLWYSIGRKNRNFLGRRFRKLTG